MEFNTLVAAQSGLTSMAFIEGLVAGYGIAVPVGAIAILIVNAGVRQGFATAFMAGAGAATADLVFAAIAAMAGHALSALLAPVALPLRIASGVLLLALGAYGVRRWLRTRNSAERARSVMPGGWRLYRHMMGLTLLNPMTVIYFGALILGGSGARADWGDRVWFVLGAGAASLSWQTLLAGFGSALRRYLPPRAQMATIAIGNLVVLGLGAGMLIQAASALLPGAGHVQ